MLAAFIMLIAAIFAISPFASTFVEQWARRDVELRSTLVFNSVRDELANLLAVGATTQINIYSAASLLTEGCWRSVTVITEVRSYIAVRSCQRTFLARKLHALRAPVSPPLPRMTETLLLVRSLLLLTRQAVTSFCYTI
ncbi:MAG TPA: hypothetical protein VKC66_19295 [Xanthobacteraceae bacterium]|nr:hypothetical protein [Xanthobacteraceae bacterium]